jgi:hypothetical protein
MTTRQISRLEACPELELDAKDQYSVQIFQIRRVFQVWLWYLQYSAFVRHRLIAHRDIPVPVYIGTFLLALMHCRHVGRLPSHLTLRALQGSQATATF